jgi:hypothetical protein
MHIVLGYRLHIPAAPEIRCPVAIPRPPLTLRRSRGVFWGTFFQTLEGMTEVQNPPLDIFRKYVPDVAGFHFKQAWGDARIA